MTSSLLNSALLLGVMAGHLIVSLKIFHDRKKKFDYSYFALIFAALLCGSLVYSGILWILKPLDVIIDSSVFDDPKYPYIIGFTLILFPILSLMFLIETLTKPKKEEEDIK